MVEEITRKIITKSGKKVLFKVKNPKGMTIKEHSRNDKPKRNCYCVECEKGRNNWI